MRKIRKGNTAHYTVEKPLFGKYTGTVYRPEHALSEKQSGHKLEQDEKEGNMDYPSDWKLPKVTLELFPREVELLMRAIVTRQMEIIDFLPEGVPEEYSELQSIQSELRGQLRMLDLIKKAQ